MHLPRWHVEPVNIHDLAVEALRKRAEQSGVDPDAPFIPTIRKGKHRDREVVHVDLPASVSVVFPSICPCCLAKTNPGAFIHAERTERGIDPVHVPSCATCARHVPLLDFITSMGGYLVLGLVVLTIGGLLVWKGGWLAILDPLRNRFIGMTALVAGLFLLGLYGLIVGVLMYPLDWVLARLLTKRSCICASGDRPVRVSKGLSMLAPSTRYTFDNLEYGKRFYEANVAPVASSQS